MNRINVITLCTIDQPHLIYWLESLMKNNYENYSVIGLKDKWEGWKYRTRRYIESLNNFKDDDIIIFCDSNDLLFQEDEEIILDKFLKWENDNGLNKNRIIVGAEPGCCTGEHNIKEKKENANKICKLYNNSRYRFPNGGFTMGRCINMYNLYDKLKDSDDDQSKILELYIDNEDIIYIDYKQEFCGNIPAINIYNSNMDEIVSPNVYKEHNKEFTNYWKIDNGKYINTFYNNKPSIVHFPGVSNFNLWQHYYKHINLNLNYKKSINLSFISSVLYYIIISLIAIIIIICIFIKKYKIILYILIMFIIISILYKIDTNSKLESVKHILYKNITYLNKICKDNNINYNLNNDIKISDFININISKNDLLKLKNIINNDFGYKIEYYKNDIYKFISNITPYPVIYILETN